MSYLTSKAMQTTAIGTVANSLPENKEILITLLNSSRYIPYTDLLKFSVLQMIFAKFLMHRWQNIRLRQKGSANITVKAAWLLFPRNQVPIKRDRIF